MPPDPETTGQSEERPVRMNLLVPALAALGAVVFAAPAPAAVQRTVMVEEFGFQT